MTQKCGCPKGSRMNPYQQRRGAMPADRKFKKMIPPEPPMQTDFEQVRDEANLGARDRVANIVGDSAPHRFPKI